MRCCTEGLRTLRPPRRLAGLGEGCPSSCRQTNRSPSVLSPRMKSRSSPRTRATTSTHRSSKACAADMKYASPPSPATGWPPSAATHWITSNPARPPARRCPSRRTWPICPMDLPIPTFAVSVCTGSSMGLALQGICETRNHEAGFDRLLDERRLAQKRRTIRLYQPRRYGHGWQPTRRHWFLSASRQAARRPLWPMRRQRQLAPFYGDPPCSPASGYAQRQAAWLRHFKFGKVVTDAISNGVQRRQVCVHPDFLGCRRNIFPKCGIVCVPNELVDAPNVISPVAGVMIILWWLSTPAEPVFSTLSM